MVCPTNWSSLSTTLPGGGGGGKNISASFFPSMNHILRMTMRCTHMHVQTFWELKAKKKIDMIFPDCSQFCFCIQAVLLVTHFVCAKMSEKCKRVIVTMEKRLSALKRIDKVESVLKMCSVLNAGKMNDWRRDRSAVYSVSYKDIQYFKK